MKDALKRMMLAMVTIYGAEDELVIDFCKDAETAIRNNDEKLFKTLQDIARVLSMKEIIRECPMCGTISMINVDEEGYKAWRNGELIQRALPDVSSEDRETLISGICAFCQDGFFEEEEEECSNNCRCCPFDGGCDKRVFGE